MAQSREGLFQPGFSFTFEHHSKGRNGMYDENNDYSVPLPDETFSEMIEQIARLMEGDSYEAGFYW